MRAKIKAPGLKGEETGRRALREFLNAAPGGDHTGATDKRTRERGDEAGPFPISQRSNNATGSEKTQIKNKKGIACGQNVAAALAAPAP
jgi:hypothetical protein